MRNTSSEEAQKEKPKIEVTEKNPFSLNNTERRKELIE